MVDLMPCPFCGGHAELVEELAEAMVGDYSSHADLQNKMAQRRRFARAILPILHRERAAAHAAGRAAERASAVDYFRGLTGTEFHELYCAIADAIERGQHGSKP